MSLTFSISIVCSWSIVLFRWDHINLAVVANSLGTLGYNIIQPTRSRNEPYEASNWFTQPKSVHQARFTTSHAHNAWSVSSGCFPQRWHCGFVNIFFLIRFTLVGKLFVHAFQRICFTLPGIFNFQIPNHRHVTASLFEPEANSIPPPPPSSLVATYLEIP